MMLDPEWMKDSCPEVKREAFFHGILPILTLRFDENNPYKSDIKPFKPRDDPWASTFFGSDFNPNKLLDAFKGDPGAVLEGLYDFVVLERAKVMYEKLWVMCSEAYFIGLAIFKCHRPGRDGIRRGNLKQRRKELQGALASIKNRADPYILNFLNAYYKEVKLDIDAIPTPTTENSLSSNLREVSSTFLKLKQRFERGEIPLKTPTFLCDRFVQITTLLGGHSDQANWKGHAIMDDVWRTYQEGPFGVGKKGCTQSLASHWVVLCT